ncbi:MAG: uroporphyrinogen-III synthase [Pseudomonadota bacterium]
MAAPASVPGARPVLITRPGASAEAEIAALALLGVPAIAAPLTRIEPVLPRPPVPAEAQALIFTSAEAVAPMAEDPVARRLPAYCVGPRTRAAAAAAGFAAADGPAPGDVAALGERLQSAPETHFHHAAGRHVAGDLAAALAPVGKSVTRSTVYEAVPLPISEAVRAALATGGIAAVGLWSARHAAFFAEACHAEAWPLGATDAVAISDKAAAPLSGLGFREVVVAPTPDGDTMRRLLATAAGRSGA